MLAFLVFYLSYTVYTKIAYTHVQLIRYLHTYSMAYIKIIFCYVVVLAMMVS